MQHMKNWNPEKIPLSLVTQTFLDISQSIPILDSKQSSVNTRWNKLKEAKWVMENTRRCFHRDNIDVQARNQSGFKSYISYFLDMEKGIAQITVPLQWIWARGFDFFFVGHGVKRGALGYTRNRKAEEKFIQNLKTANKISQNRKPHTKLYTQIGPNREKK